MSDPQTDAAPFAGHGSARASGQRQLLFQKLKAKKESRLGTEQAIPRLGATRAPLSFGQQRLWFFEQFEPGNLRFNILTALRMRGRLDISALGASLDAMVRRHEVLRTTFVAEDGRPLQVVARHLAVAVPTVDLAGLPEPGSLLMALVTAEAHRPFDLNRGPLLRALLLRLGAEEHVLVLAMHQITVDRWSRGLSVRELTAFYRSFVTGEPAELPALSIQYSDYAQWQRRHLTGEVLSGLLDYWRGELSGELPDLELPLDRPRPAVQTFRGGNVYSVLPRPLLDRLEALGQGEGATLFMVLLAGFGALLSRATGQEDMVLGSPIANRRHKQIEPLMGFFLNLLAFRVQSGGDPTFRQLLGRARETALGAYAHQDLPFERLVEELGVERDLSRHPLFQTTLVLQNAAMPELTLPGLEVGLLEVDWGTTAFDLSFFFWETALWENLEEGLSVIVNYNADLFDATTVRRLAGQLDRLLTDALADPERRLSELALLSVAERHQVLGEWGSGEEEMPEEPWETGLDRLFERRAAANPQAVALDYAGETVPYGELDRRANRLARVLLCRGVGAESVVALCLEPSAELATAILAILKAGGAYLPLAPDLPAERLGLMLADADAALVLTRSELLDRLPAGSLPVLCLDTEASAIAAESADVAVRGDAGPGALAYVLYTSGSTGRPKPVGVPHRAVVRLVRGLPLALAPGDGVAQAASPAFDAFTFELWAPLLSGARSVGLPREAVLSAHGLAAELARRRIDVLFLATALFARLAAEVPGAFAGLRHLLFGGEAVDPGRVRAVLAAGPPAHLLHVYGPTEATTFSSWHEVGELPRTAGTVPIGRPLGGTALRVLDGDLAPLAIGAEGDLYVGGDGLARGYLGRPAETAAAFLPDPFCRVPGERLYRTGDRARWRAEGDLDFRGRRDAQVKIRGFRVEPEEVRAALALHPEVAEALVVARESSPGDRRLVGYVVPRPGASPQGAALVAFLGGRLPPYMVPAVLMILDRLPTTPGGKIDLTALPAPPDSSATATMPAMPAMPAVEYRLPITAEEVGLAAIWEEVLSCGKVGVFDDFFALGGHSLHAVQVMARVRRVFGVDLPVRSLYTAPTLAHLARSVAVALRKEI
jgi:amino acid adenylation domain-containing protein